MKPQLATVNILSRKFHNWIEKIALIFHLLSYLGKLPFPITVFFFLFYILNIDCTPVDIFNLVKFMPFNTWCWIKNWKWTWKPACPCTYTYTYPQKNVHAYTHTSICKWKMVLKCPKWKIVGCCWKFYWIKRGKKNLTIPICITNNQETKERCKILWKKQRKWKKNFYEY